MSIFALNEFADKTNQRSMICVPILVITRIPHDVHEATHEPSCEKDCILWLHYCPPFEQTHTLPIDSFYLNFHRIE